MAKSTSSSKAAENQQPPFYRLQSKIKLPYNESTPSPTVVRGLLTPMAIEELSPGVYQVRTESDRHKTNLNTTDCTCLSGSTHDSYKCMHYHHVRQRRETGTVTDPPVEEDPVLKDAKENKPIADASREREKQIDRADGVVAGPDESLLQCVACESYTAVEPKDGLESSPYVCPSCPPLDDGLVALDTPTDDDDVVIVSVEGVVEDESARSYYPGEEDVFSLADMFSQVEGVSKNDSVVLVSEASELSETGGVVFVDDTRPVPQGALRELTEKSL